MSECHKLHRNLCVKFLGRVFSLKTSKIFAGIDSLLKLILLNLFLLLICIGLQTPDTELSFLPEVSKITMTFLVLIFFYHT